MPTSQQIHDDLRPHLAGAVAVDDLTRTLYATDASPFHILPSAVVVPQTAADVGRTLQYAFEMAIPVGLRGCGTGTAGGCLTPGIVLDFSTHLRAVQAIGPDWVRVQSGATLEDVNAELTKQRRRVPVANTIAGTATIAGLIAGGDLPPEKVTALGVAWDTGDISDLPFETPNNERCQSLANALQSFLNEQSPNLPLRPPGSGYALAKHDTTLARLMIGSEGTLGAILEATLATEAIPVTAAAVIGFAGLENAVAAYAHAASRRELAGCDVLDQRFVAFARSRGCELIVPPGCAAVMILTAEAAAEADARAAVHTAAETVCGHGGVLLHATTADDAALKRIRHFFEAATFGFAALAGPKRPVPLFDDITLPPERIVPFLDQLQTQLRQADVTAAVHLALPQRVHCRPLLDLSDRAEQARAWALTDAVHTLAIGLGGVLGSAFGVGLTRTPWMEKQAAALFPLFREVKRIFDPKAILNPGTVVGPDPSRPAWPFTPATGRRTELVQMAGEAAKCNACGDCRTRRGPARMCPAFRSTGDETASPRAMANLVKHALQHGTLAADEVKAVADRCIQCGQCQDDCRAGVDIPHLMIDAKAAHYALHGFDRHEWLIARSERLSALAGTFALTANVLLGSRPARWLFEKLLGLDRRRMLHRYTHRTFLRRQLVQRLFRKLPSNPRKLAYFVDTFANSNDPLLAEATVAVLQHHGYAVHVPRRQRGSGMPALSVGDVDTARARARYNVPPLAELVRDGYRVICSEPTAALMLTQEYPRLLPDDDDAKLVAANTVELTAFLGELQTRGELKPAAKDMAFALGHHVPCHLKSLGKPVVTKALLEAMPGLTVATIDVGCSGAAQIRGFTKAHFEESLRIGTPVFEALKHEAIQFATSECSACRVQLQQGAGKRALHPVQWLAIAYGLVPALERRLSRPLSQRLTG